MMFKFGKRSRKELKGVHPHLVAVVKHALNLSSIDFKVIDGVRTKEEQQELVDRGASKTMNSKHRKQEDGYGHAVDLVGLLHGKTRWEWPVVYEVAAVMQQAAEECQVKVRWGGAWTVLNDNAYPDVLVKLYKKRKKAKGKKPFVDGPHFELA